MTSREKKAYREPLKVEWAEALLAAPASDGVPLAQKLRHISLMLEGVVEEAQGVIDKNPLTATVASAAARAAGKRGSARIFLERDGSVILEVSQGGDPAVTRKVSSLPSLASLRKEATDMGIPIDRVGRSKRLLMTAIETVRTTQRVSEEAPKKVRKQKSVAPVDLPYPMSSELPELDLDPDPRAH